MDVSTWELRAKGKVKGNKAVIKHKRTTSLYRASIDLANALARPNKADFSQLHRAEYQEKLIELRRDINATDTDAQVGVPAYQQRKRQEVRYILPRTCGFPKTDFRRVIQTLQTLEDQLKALQPPTQSKFSFKKQPAGPSSGAPTTSTETPVSQAEPLQAEDTVPTHQKHIVYSSSTSTSAPSLANLSRCFVDLRSGPIPSLYLKDLQDTVVVASDVQGSVLVHNAKSCLLAINCHQVRLRCFDAVH